MRFSHFFIERPRFATSLSIIVVIVGLIAYSELPVSLYPNIAPPQIRVNAVYPGANSETISNTVAAPLEQQINGVENMLYMASQSSNNGSMVLNVFFEPGTDLDMAQVLVQNRVTAAEPRLPEEVRRRGITTTKTAADTLMSINIYSPNHSRDQTFIGNYAALQVTEQLKRVSGIGEIGGFGANEYAMRVWLQPDRLATLDLTPGDVLEALRAQNLQIAGGGLNQSPSPAQDAFEVSVETRGRFSNAAEFGEVIIKGEARGVVRLKDVARIELGSENYSTKGYIGEHPSALINLRMKPGANALETAENVIAVMDRLAEQFPPGLEYKIIYNPTDYIRASIDEVLKTLFIAIALVVIVILLFLQSWRAAVIPVVAIPVSLVGTFAIMLLLGYSLNMLSLFGLILAVGIVVDDAIVVVENVQRKLGEGEDIFTATRSTMDEVGGALIATSLVLLAVFLPTLALQDIAGAFYKQFGVTIAAATLISTFVSLTLCPALAVLVLRNNKKGDRRMPPAFITRITARAQRLLGSYSSLVAVLVRRSLLVAATYVGLIALTGWQFNLIPTGFIPQQDRSAVIALIQLPPGSTLNRTDTVTRKVNGALQQIDDIENTVSLVGFSFSVGAIASNGAVVFTVLKPVEERRPIEEVMADVRAATAGIDEALVLVGRPAPVPGIGRASGLQLMIQDRAGKGLSALAQEAEKLAAAANAAPEISDAYTTIDTNPPRVFLDIDVDRARRLGVPLPRIYEALEVYLGSTYVNDFNLQGRSFRVTAQADSDFRRSAGDIGRLRVRNDRDQMVPLGSLATVSDASGPAQAERYNLYPAAALNGDTAPGFSSGQAILRMEQLAEEVLSDGFEMEWTELALQQKRTGNTAEIIFALAVLFVFLLLVAQYESWTLPLAVILIVPMCLLSAGFGLLIAGSDNNILTQIGFVVLIALASKNAILIVEFARQKEQLQGMSPGEAVVNAARQRLRPILMTAFSFILGVVPLLVATGAGFEMRRALGLTVFSGMLGVTLFGLLFTPVFYVLCRRLAMFGQTNRNWLAQP